MDKFDEKAQEMWPLLSNRYLSDPTALLAQFGRGIAEEAEKILRGLIMTSPSPIGPLHGVGWNQAIGEALEKIRVAWELEGVKDK